MNTSFDANMGARAASMAPRKDEALGRSPLERLLPDTQAARRFAALVGSL